METTHGILEEEACSPLDEPVWRYALESSIDTAKGTAQEGLGLPQWATFADLLRGAAEKTWLAGSAWFQVAFLLAGPLWRAIQLTLSLCYPWTRALALSIWRWETSLTAADWVLQVVAATSILTFYLLRRLFSRRRYLQRLSESFKLQHAKADRAYQKFLLQVERKSRMLASFLPHAIYWGLFVVPILRYFPLTASVLADGALWSCTTVLLPAIRTLFVVDRVEEIELFLRDSPPHTEVSSKPSPSKTRRRTSKATRGTEKTVSGTEAKADAGRAQPLDDIPIPLSSRALTASYEGDKVLMYWVVFSCMWCCHYAFQLLPGSLRVLTWFSHTREIAFFAFIWLQLPGKAGGLHVAFSASAFFLVDSSKQGKKDTGAGLVQRLLSWCHMLLSGLTAIGIISKSTQDAIIVSQDSWPLVPASVFIFTPTFLASAGCVLVSMTLPCTATIKALYKRDNASAKAGETMARKARWLRYWAIFGIFWEITNLLAPILRWVPLTKHAQLLFYIWLQLPVFNGSAKCIAAIHALLARFVSPSDE